MDWQQCKTDANSFVCVQVKMEISCLHVTILGLPFLFLLSSKLIIQLFCLAVCHLLKSCKFVSGNSPHYSSVDAATTQNGQLRSPKFPLTKKVLAFCPVDEMFCDRDQAQKSETSVAAIRHRGLCHNR